MSSLFSKEEGSSRSDSKQTQVAAKKLTEHYYNNVDIAAGLFWHCFSSLFFLDSNYIDKFWIYSCIYHFNQFSFLEFSFICDVYGVTLLFYTDLTLFAVAWINNLTILFDINNYSVFTFTMVTISLPLTRDLTVFTDLRF